MRFGLSGTVLPVHPQPKPDEIFSSWFCRIAQDNQIKLHTLEVQLWGRDKQIWTRDIDRSIGGQTLAEVASIAGTSLERAKETSLSSYEGILFEKLTASTNSDWILPSGVYHRIRHRPAMQFCSLCLATDIVPYYRKSWRLAFSTFCDLHNVLLHDCCPRCRAPVMFHRQELGNRAVIKTDSITLCTTCGFDLKRSPAYQAPVVDIEAWNTLKSQVFFLEMGWTHAGNETFQYSHLYFDALRNFVQKLRSGRTPRRLLGYIVQRYKLINARFTVENIPFEFRSLMERHYLLQIATWYLLDWPNRLVEVSKNLGIRYSELMHDFEAIPFWFDDKARCLEIKPLGPSAGEKEAMRSLLRSTSDPIKLEMLGKVVRTRLGNKPLRWLDASFIRESRALVNTKVHGGKIVRK